MQAFTRTFARPTTAPAAPRPMRFARAVHLDTGDPVSLVADLPRQYEERPRFGPAAPAQPVETPVDWVARHVEDAAALADLAEDWTRPIHIPTPGVALCHPDLATACEAAVARTRLTPQEVCLQVRDSDLHEDREDAFEGVRRLRSVGFRVAVDARRTWCAPDSEGLRLMLDSALINARDLAHDDDLEAYAQRASGSGMLVIAAGARWRDGDVLAGYGITHALAPRTDG